MAVVLFFLGTECPVSNGYAPEMQRLSEDYGPRGVVFRGITFDGAAVEGLLARRYDRTITGSPVRCAGGATSQPRASEPRPMLRRNWLSSPFTGS